MASAETLDFSELLNPISEASPSGVELKGDRNGLTEYTTIKTARDSARTAEREWRIAKPEDRQAKVDDAKKQWNIVSSKAPRILASISKDLWVAAWYLEYLTRAHGFAGVRDGVRLIREICEKYWDGIHPAPDDEGYVTTVMQLEALNGVDSDGTLISALDEIKILDGPNGTRISGSDYYYAMEAELDSSKASIDRRNQLRATIDEALKLTPVDTLTCWLEDAEASLAEWDKLREVLEARCRPAEGADSVAPPSSRVRDRLNLSIERLRRLIGKPAGDAPPDQAAGAASGGEAGGAATSAKGTAVSGTIQTREEAFRALLTVASFFRRTEPHSPISYALEQVVKWGRMTLPELIRELIADETTRGELAKRTGIPLESEDSSS